MRYTNNTAINHKIIFDTIGKNKLIIWFVLAHPQTLQQSKPRKICLDVQCTYYTANTANTASKRNKHLTLWFVDLNLTGHNKGKV